MLFLRDAFLLRPDEGLLLFLSGPAVAAALREFMIFWWTLAEFLDDEEEAAAAGAAWDIFRLFDLDIFILAGLATKLALCFMRRKSTLSQE